MKNTEKVKELLLKGKNPTLDWVFNHLVSIGNKPDSNDFLPIWKFLFRSQEALAVSDSVVAIAYAYPLKRVEILHSIDFFLNSNIRQWMTPQFIMGITIGALKAGAIEGDSTVVEEVLKPFDTKLIDLLLSLLVNEKELMQHTPDDKTLGELSNAIGGYVSNIRCVVWLSRWYEVKRFIIAVAQIEEDNPNNLFFYHLETFSSQLIDKMAVKAFVMLAGKGKLMALTGIYNRFVDEVCS